MVNIQDFSFAYRRKPIFRGLNLHLEPGHIYGLLGQNGTGKSTLLRSLAGFLFPKGGRIDVLGFEPRRRQPAFLQQVFLLPEEFHLPAIPISRWVRHLAGFYPRFSQEQFHRNITGFDIPLEGSMQEMSYGQQKKLLISFALAVNASLLLMDEPTNGLDILSKSQFRKVIAGSLDERQCILISTHQVKDLENLIDRILVIEEGRILFDQGMDTISQKLTFTLSFDPEQTAQALYSESSLKGNALVLPNTYGEDSRPDLEMLYKAVILESEKINRVFKP
ncbi:MAG: ATP-binding cassette domain-containing protein [Chitinophagaceae bacterium]|nr:ATP-binding cassette domain-containing protein [Chitinophagaceae bacterium]